MSYVTPALQPSTFATLVVRETPTGAVDGSNATFTLAGTPITGSEEVFLNGLLQTVTNDYTISGATITFVIAPLSGDTLRVCYLTSATLAASNFIVRETPTGAVDGSNATFTLAHTPVAGTEEVFLNGLLQTVTNDYTISGATITFVIAPLSGDILRVCYEI
jgi:hypothetical protein